MTMNRREAHIVKELHECAEDPDYHPLIRALFKDAASIIVELRIELDQLRQEDTDHG